jgi:hypothetical protein
MGKPLCRQGGIYQWDARVSGAKGGMRQTVLITVFCDTRKEAVDAVCEQAAALRYSHPTVDHITKLQIYHSPRQS